MNSGIAAQIKSCGINPLSKLGSGAYGQVYKVEVKSGEIKALKTFTSKEYDTAGVKGVNEFTILNSFRHPNVLMSDGVITSDDCKTKINDVWLLLPLWSGVLTHYIKTRPLLNDLIKYMHKMLLGIDYLHSNKWLHLDLKPANILINAVESELAIGDFGLSVRVDNGTD